MQKLSRYSLLKTVAIFSILFGFSFSCQTAANGTNPSKIRLMLNAIPKKIGAFFPATFRICRSFTTAPFKFNYRNSAKNLIGKARRNKKGIGIGMAAAGASCMLGTYIGSHIWKRRALLSQRELEEGHQQNNGLLTQIANLEEEAKTQRKQLEQKDSAVEASKRGARFWQRELDLIRLRNRELNNLVDTLRGDNGQLQAQTAELEAQNGNLAGCYDRIMTQVSELEEKSKRLGEHRDGQELIENTQLKNQIATAEIYNQKLREESEKKEGATHIAVAKALEQLGIPAKATGNLNHAQKIEFIPKYVLKWVRIFARKLTEEKRALQKQLDDKAK